MNRLTRTLLSLTLLTAAHPAARADILSDHPGIWLGDMKIPNGPTLKIGAELFTRADGTPWASIAVASQGNFDIPVTALRETGDVLHLDFAGAGLDLTWRGDRFDGVFQEVGGPKLSFPLTRVDTFARKAAPQTPKPPFPYRDEQLAVRSTDGVTLGATLSIPAGVAHPNAVILVHGSGPSTRDADGRFAVLADALARQGIAVLRFDKRGVARSTGSYDKHTLAQLAADVHAAVDAVRARHQFNRVGLVGHSEGPGIAAAVAARYPKSVDFIVSLAGVGLKGIDMMLLQDRATATANGASPEQAEVLVRYARSYYQTVVANPDAAQRIAALNALDAARSPTDTALADKFKMRGGSLSVDNGFAGKDFLRATLVADTPSDWRGVKCPVLALNGSVDSQVPVESLAGIVSSLKAGGNRRVESHVLPSLNHLFQTAVTGAESEYAGIEEILAPVAIERVAAFVKKQR